MTMRGRGRQLGTTVATDPEDSGDISAFNQTPGTFSGQLTRFLARGMDVARLPGSDTVPIVSTMYKVGRRLLLGCVPLYSLLWLGFWLIVRAVNALWNLFGQHAAPSGPVDLVWQLFPLHLAILGHMLKPIWRSPIRHRWLALSAGVLAVCLTVAVFFGDDRPHGLPMVLAGYFTSGILGALALTITTHLPRWPDRAAARSRPPRRRPRR
jgi:hypothetical protein